MNVQRTIVKNSKLNKGIIIGIVLLVKLILMGLFSSDYQNQMFIPFVNVFLTGNNPYDFFHFSGLPSSFPYFPIMLLIESLGGVLLRWISPVSIFWQNFIFKLPLP